MQSSEPPQQRGRAKARATLFKRISSKNETPDTATLSRKNQKPLQIAASPSSEEELKLEGVTKSSKVSLRDNSLAVLAEKRTIKQQAKAKKLKNSALKDDIALPSDFAAYLEEAWKEIDCNLVSVAAEDRVDLSERKRVHNNTAAMKTRLFFRIRQMGANDKAFFNGIKRNVTKLVQTLSQALSHKSGEDFRQKLLGMMFQRFG